MEKIILILATIVGIFFRVWQLDKIPAGLAMDEAAFGYNSWSIATNLHDEYGKFLPYAFRSFADFKLPAYGYLTAPVIKMFGPGVWQTRTVSVIAGLISCCLLYLIIKRLANRKLAIMASLIMLWSPWGILFSRGAFEGNLGLMFLLLGVFGLGESIKNRNYLFLAAVAFALANYSYIAFKFVSPVFLLLWIVGYRKIHRFFPKTVLALLLFLFLSAPGYLMFSGISGNNRINSLLKLNPKETGYPEITQITSNYLTYFSPRNLFFRPDPVRQRHFETVSTFYPFMFVFFIFGLLAWFKNRKTELSGWMLVGLLVGPIPAALSQDPFATLRAIGAFPAYCVLLAMGTEQLLIAPIVRKWRWIAIPSLFMLMSISVYTALMVMKNGQTAEWNDGIGELISRLKYYPNRTVFFDIPHDVYPNIALAMKYPPVDMQKDNSNFDLNKYYTDPVFSEVVIFGKYRVGKTDRSSAAEIPGAILIVRPENISSSEPNERGWKGKLFSVLDSNGKTLFLAYELN